MVGLSDRIILVGSEDSPGPTYLLTKCPGVPLKRARSEQSQPSAAQARSAKLFASSPLHFTIQGVAAKPLNF